MLWVNRDKAWRRCPQCEKGLAYLDICESCKRDNALAQARREGFAAAQEAAVAACHREADYYADDMNVGAQSPCRHVMEEVARGCAAAIRALSAPGREGRA